MEKKTGANENLILSVWFLLKRNLVLILAIVLLSTACGLVYGFVKKPNYTATQEIVFTAIDQKSDDIVTNYRAMEALRGTVVDFCNEGVVVDRADFYYLTFIQKSSAAGPDYTVDDFIYEIQNTEDPYSTSDSGTTNRGYITRENVYVSASVETDNVGEYAFSMGYTDKNKQDAIIKAKLYRLAFEREIQPEAGKSGVKYFDGVTINVIDLESSGVTSDVSKVKFAAIGLIIGVVLSAVAVYIINVTDTTIKTKEELEEITESTVIAYINDQEGGKR